ncbi:MAG: ATP-dependent Clp protease ATP-binding subunit [Patescibacteria group bacterium]
MSDFLNNQNPQAAVPLPPADLPPPVATEAPIVDPRVSGVLVEGRFWHFEDDINESMFIYRQVRKSTNRIINAVVIAFGFGGLAIFVLGVIFAEEAAYKLDYWTKPNTIQFGFWFAVLAALFLFYRWAEAKTRIKTVPRLAKETVEPVTVLPSVETVQKRSNIGDVLSDDSWVCLEDAYKLAKDGGHSEVNALHLFVGSLSTKPVNLLFMRLGISFEQMKDALRRRMATVPRGEAQFGLTAREIVAQAFHNALLHKRKMVSPIEIFVETYKKDEFLQELMYSLAIEQEELENVVMWVRINEQLRERHEESSRAKSFKPTGTMNRAYTAIATPFLDSVSEDLTKAAVMGRLPILVGREKEVETLLRAIEGGNQSVVLVGPPGVGKDAVISGIAELMAEERVPKVLQDKRLLRLSIPHVVSTQAGAGAEERLLFAMQQVGMSGNVILVIDDLDQLASTAAGGVNLASVLSSELEKGYTFVIATTTPQGYTNAVEKTILTQHFEKIIIDEPERNAAIQIIESKVGGIENQNKIIFTYAALAALVDLSMRYMHDTYLPQKALLLAKEVALMVAKRGQEWGRVTKEDVAQIISDKTRVPVTQVAQEEASKLLDLEKRIHERVIGQEEAVKAVSNALRRARAELRAENRPIANFLFLGPTGVGKTELAKATAEVYFSNEEAMLRFDMSEYQDKMSISRLIGSSGEGGLLTEAVRQNPFSLLLLDELEKAHPDILNLFLQVMDDGRLTDGQGRTVDFTNVILIATSNAGTQFIQDSVAIGTPLEQVKMQLMETELKTVYRPEFLNRFDGVMVFKPLSQDDVVAIAYLMIAKVAKRLEAKGISFKASDEVVYELAQKGYDPKFGARPLRRVIQETVDNAIAEQLLRGQVGRRDTLVLEPGGVVRIEKAEVL